MLQSQKIISCLLCVAILLGAMVTFTCFAVDGENSESTEPPVVESQVTESVPEESQSEGDSSSVEGEESGVDEESGITEESGTTEESSEEESMAETSQEEQNNESNNNNYYYSGDQSYPPYEGSRVLKNPNIVEEESKVEKKPVDKNIKDWSDVARRWVFLPIIFTLLSIGGLVGFNVYANKQNGKKNRKYSQRRREESASERSKDTDSNRRNFDRPKH